MSSRAQTLETRFFVDAQDFLSRGMEIARKLAKNSEADVPPDEIHELFRCVHSVKSEASYLKYEKLAGLAHELEEKLERVRSGEARAVSGNPAEIEEQLEVLIGEVKLEESRVESASRIIQPKFNAFEQKLLDEGERRGERCYRVIFEIDQDAPMKRARAYLVLSNLEQISTVIRTEPSLNSTGASEGGEAEEDADVYVCYLTAAVSESEIYSALDVDQILRPQIDALTFPLSGRALQMREGAGLRTSDASSYYRLTGRKLDQIIAYADDLRLRLRELELDPGRSREGVDALGKLNRIADGLYDELAKVRVASLSEEYPSFRELVADLADRLGKVVVFETGGGELTLDRRILAALSDPLKHLLRNAVDHGIEKPEERKSAGKEETGNVSLIVREESDRLIIIVSDDGRGVDEEALRREIEGSGENADDLFQILSRPGYTTLPRATDLSGRGVGLDLVARRVEEIGGQISARSQPGGGITFEISVPKGPSYARLLFFKFGDELYAIPVQAVSEIRRMQKGELKRDARGYIFCSRTPAYAGRRAAKVGEVSSYGSYAVVVSYLGKSGSFLADDVLFEHEVNEDLLTEAQQEDGRRLTVSFGSVKREFNLLSPGVVQSTGL